ncbi:hypothetical protein D3C71_2089040 [compost metagenome]
MLIGAHGMPAPDSASIHSWTVRSAIFSPTKATVASKFSTRALFVTNRGSSRKASIDATWQNLPHWASLPTPSIMNASFA